MLFFSLVFSASGISSRSIVVSHGGALTIGSGPEGAVVKFTLPAAKVG